jgi:branched-chain amino acid transport system permease protein
MSAQKVADSPRQADKGVYTGIRWAVMLAGVVVVATLPWTIATPYWVGQIYALFLLALLASSLTLSLGYAGELAVGQVALYAAGGYTAAYVGVHLSSEVPVTMLAAIAAALAAGLLVAAPSLRLAGWTLAVVTFFAIIVLPNLVQSLPSITGGVNGLAGLAQATIFGSVLQRSTLYVLAVVCVAVWTLAFRNFVTSRHGGALKTLRQSPQLATAMGISTFRLKLLVHLLAAVPAGIAGALFVYWYQFIDVSTFSFSLVIVVLAASLLGGSQSVAGPLLGAAILQLGPLQSTDFSNYSLLVYGCLLVIIGIALPGGLMAVLVAGRRRIAAVIARSWPSPAGAALSKTTLIPPAADGQPQATVSDRSSYPTPVLALKGSGARLEVRQVSKAFGGVGALSEVDLVAEPGKVTALIGANGSGKTTLLNVISGFLAPDSGTVSLEGRHIERRSPSALAAAGIRRTFQTPIIPESMTAEEVVAVARYSADRLGVLPALLRLSAFWRITASDRAVARGALEFCELLDHAATTASSLPLGLRRLVEVARAIAGSPRVMLLDEPAAGLESNEIADLARVVADLRQAGLTILLVEHNFDFIRSLADEVYVLDRGFLLARGSVAQIECNPAVIERYFGGRKPTRDAPPVERIVP